MVDSRYMFLHLIPNKQGLLVEYDLDGKMLQSWHDPTGKGVENVAEADLQNNKLYIGSFYNDFIAVVDY